MDKLEAEKTNPTPTAMNLGQLTEGFENLTFLEPRTDFDPCIVGVVQRNSQEPSVCYAYEKVIDTLKIMGKCSEEDAEDHFSYNIIGAYVGETTPSFLFSGEASSYLEMDPLEQVNQ